MNNPIIQFFKDITEKDLYLAGGKGANLGIMSRAGFNVPQGFCITTNAFNSFMRTIPGIKHFFPLLSEAGSDIETVKILGLKIRSTMEQSPIPSEVKNAVVEAWKTMGQEEDYAVRSSATAEDLPSASFAGQQDTYLNITKKEDLLKCVRSCWASLFTDRAILYRNQNSFSHDDVKLSVVIQRMIFPESSGILFTADPLTGNRNIVAIDAGFGLGEALVSGLITPDNYKVDKRDFSILKLDVGKKKLMIRPAPGGGTEKVELPGKEQTRQVLDRHTVIRLAQIGCRIEKFYGSPQDLEWAIEKGTLYILQSRPITSLFPVPAPVPGEKLLHVYISFGHIQMMTGAVQPMGLSVWQHLLRPAKAKKKRIKNLLACTAGGRLYIDMSPLLFSRAGRIYSKAFRIVDTLMAQSLEALSDHKDFRDAKKKTKYKLKIRSVIKWVIPVLFKIQLHVWFKKPEKQGAILLAWIRKNIETINSIVKNKSSTTGKLLYLLDIIENIFRKGIPFMMPFVASGIMSRIMIKKLTGMDEKDLQEIGSGLSGNVTTEMDLMVGDLADLVKRNQTLVKFLKYEINKPPGGRKRGDFLKALGKLDGCDDFLKAWKEFIRLYGMRGPGEINICSPGWKDDPISLIQVILGRLDEQEGSHRRYHEKLKIDGTHAAEQLSAANGRRKMGWIKRRLLKRLSRVFRCLMALREHPKYLIVQILDIARELLLEAADELKIKTEDIWFLELHEVIRALNNPSMDTGGLTKERREKWEYYSRLQPPRVITSDGEILNSQYNKNDFPEGALPGTGISAGIVEGPAHVILDPTAGPLLPGEILVAPFTDPGWTPLFINAAAVVIEVGGMMTHGSVIAREYGIPGVVSVLDATVKIKTGQMIRVNGNKGYVEPL